MITKQLTLTLALTAACLTAQEEQSMGARFEAMVARYIEEFPALSPASATGLGDHRYDTALDEVVDSAEFPGAPGEIRTPLVAALPLVTRSSLATPPQVRSPGSSLMPT
jgi:hypothetical protein